MSSQLNAVLHNPTPMRQQSKGKPAMAYNDYRPSSTKKQDPIYRLAWFRHVAVAMPVSDVLQSVIVLDLPAHGAFPACKLHIPGNAQLPYGTYSRAPNHYPGTILLDLPYQLQQASGFAGISLEVWDAQALLHDLDRVRRYVPGCM